VRTCAGCRRGSVPRFRSGPTRGRTCPLPTDTGTPTATAGAAGCALTDFPSRRKTGRRESFAPALDEPPATPQLQTETETAHKRATRPGPVLHEIFVVAGRLVQERCLPRARGRLGRRRRRRVACPSDTQRLARNRALKTSTRAPQARERTGLGFGALAAVRAGKDSNSHHRNPAGHDSRCDDGCG
jgi:hypothetical protein